MSIKHTLQSINREFGDKIDHANAEAVKKIQEAHTYLIDVQPAISVVPGMKKNMILHAGVKIPFKRTEGRQRAPFRKAIIGCALYENLADSEEEAIRLLENGDIELSPCQDHDCIGTMAGVYSASTPVLAVKNKTHGNTAFCTIFEGSQKERLKFGVYNEEVAKRLRWIEHTLAPVLRAVVKKAGDIDLTAIISRGLRMGDESHSRTAASTSLFAGKIMPYLVQLDFSKKELSKCAEFIVKNDSFFGTLSMPAAKAMLDAAHGVDMSTIITGMIENCRVFAIRVSGLGNRWFTAPIEEKYKTFIGKGYKGREYNLSEVAYGGGESVFKEAAGLGACAIAGAPALGEYAGGTVEQKLEITDMMYRITVAESKNFWIPYLNYRGTPTGIDLRKVIETGITPFMDEAVSDVDGGLIAAGVSRVPMTCIEKAITYLYDTTNK